MRAGRFLLAILWAPGFSAAAALMAGVVRGVWMYALDRGGQEIPAVASDRMPWHGPCIIAEAAGLVGFAMGIVGWVPGTRRRPGGGRANR